MVRTCCLTMVVLALAAAESAAADTIERKPIPLEDLMERWDESVGMWATTFSRSQLPEGHYFVTRHASERLLKIAQLGYWDQVPTERVLRNLRQDQVTTGDHRGQFRWNLHDKRPIDGNAAFFNLSRLIPLYQQHRDLLSPTERELLLAMFADGHDLFAHKVSGYTEAEIRYVNAFLGDAVCLYLLKEILERDDFAAYDRTMREILTWYQDNDWGWAEHLSDLYGKIVQNVLVVLLTGSERMPDATRRLAQDLLGELTALEEFFRGGPRVPDVRDKQFLYTSPRTPTRWDRWAQPYRDFLGPADAVCRPWPEQVLAWHYGPERLYPTVQMPPPGPFLSIPCRGAVTAEVHLTGRYRLGAFSSYPIYPDTNDDTHNGLASISRAVAFWHAGGDWACLQWLTEEGGHRRGQPMTWSGKRWARLSDTVDRARYGETRTVRESAGFLVLRRLPGISPAWTRCEDRFHLIEPSHGERQEDRVDGWYRLVLPYGEEQLTVAWHPLGALDRQPRWQAEKGEHDTPVVTWGVDLLRAPPTAGMVASLWFLQVGPTPATPPRFQMAATGVTGTATFPDDGPTVQISLAEPAGLVRP